MIDIDVSQLKRVIIAGVRILLIRSSYLLIFFYIKKLSKRRSGIWMSSLLVAVFIPFTSKEK